MADDPMKALNDMISGSQSKLDNLLDLVSSGESDASVGAATAAVLGGERAPKHRNTSEATKELSGEKSSDTPPPPLGTLSPDTADADGAAEEAEEDDTPPVEFGGIEEVVETPADMVGSAPVRESLFDDPEDEVEYPAEPLEDDLFPTGGDEDIESDPEEDVSIVTESATPDPDDEDIEEDDPAPVAAEPPRPVQPAAWMDDDEDESPLAPEPPPAPRAAFVPPSRASDDDDDDEDLRAPRSNPFSKLSGMKGRVSADGVKGFFEKKPHMKRPAIFAVAGIVVVIIALIFMGGGSPAADQHPAVSEPATVQPDEPEEEQSTVHELRPKSTSDQCPPGRKPSNAAFSGNPADAWICPRAMNMDGAEMRIELPKTAMIKSINIIPGWTWTAPNGKSMWNIYWHPTKLLWRIGDNSHQYPQVITPSQTGATLELPGNGVPAKVIYLTIQESVSPTSDAAQQHVDIPSGDEEESPDPSVAPDGIPDDSKVENATAVEKIVIMGTDL